MRTLGLTLELADGSPPVQAPRLAIARVEHLFSFRDFHTNTDANKPQSSRTDSDAEISENEGVGQ
jgi:hypothetical protein